MTTMKVMIKDPLVEQLLARIAAAASDPDLTARHKRALVEALGSLVVAAEARIHDVRIHEESIR